MIDYVPPGQTPGKAVSERQLEEEIKALGVPVQGLSSVRTHDGTLQHVIVHLKNEPNDYAKGKIAEALSAHEPKAATDEEKAEERLQKMLAKRRAGKALTAKEKDDALDILIGLYAAERI